MTKENGPTFLNPEKPNFYKDQITEMARKVIRENQVMLLSLTDADLAIPLALDGEVVGFGFLFFHEEEASLVRMIDPEHQGKGLGAQLLTQIENVARKKGVTKLASIVTDTPSARKALLEAGFTIEFADQDGETKRVKFTKKLD